ncbi:LysR family transcriptional regulator [Bradyrhizobium sp. U87765 SZCCT0131]|uniref:LysR family transcriptional regulator n=1 Tax=unclassified Bradyrhizobium TaxID=2631580 RepID=UPI001BAB11F1|nr:MULTISPECIES: LysR family transcriptional regulator [unclassified Bradyrhizobium]MBR1218769.1 LysR family transcriptional regulator [Bradyrhizobium sp. U87765 SZCCT0131]MBR1265472.1 LysR family transcriptional regulator [Bradyrhizobium sp. U87765 SZCCT0134]MBR1304268.1 LysR family transcriptional regulator [Bradyrhizobium sp. U87765 SZCCT0110]MBR1319873.1 LysR family transcriptional regulator [Bradyrhizobium sp. U87765 SZCCT0109]MBR1348199.1 LysR family transcriptional regulator [Bradyrhizo
MHPRFLKTFLAVVRTRNVTRAADEIHLAQSSVSDQIQALEADLGAQLFVRTRQGLDLTPAGDALKVYAEDILALADEARAAVASASALDGGTLTLGALETIGATRLPQWLSSFQQQQPEIAVHLKIAGSGELQQGVADGAIDAAFCFDKGPIDERLAKRVISSEPLVLIGPANGTEKAAAADIAASAPSRFIATERGCVYRHLFDKALSEAGVAPVIASEVGSIAAIGRLVAAGAGSALVPRLAVSGLLDRGEVVERAWPSIATAAQLILIWRRRRVQPPALKLFLAAADQWVTIVRSDGDHPRHAAPSPS